MLELNQGMACPLTFEIEDDDGLSILPDDVTAVELCVAALSKLYPGDITYADTWIAYFSQEDTFALPVGVNDVQLRVMLKSGDVYTASDCVMVFTGESLSDRILGGDG